MKVAFLIFECLYRIWHIAVVIYHTFTIHMMIFTQIQAENMDFSLHFLLDSIDEIWEFYKRSKQVLGKGG